FLTLNPQLQQQPVRKVDQVLVEDWSTSEDGGFPVEATVGVGARVMDRVRVLPFSRSPGREVAVAGRSQGLAQTFLRGVEDVVGEGEVSHGSPPHRVRAPALGARR